MPFCIFRMPANGSSGFVSNCGAGQKPIVMNERVQMAISSGVVTRFAPSPTGFWHMGSARTALFNWLYAKHTSGRFLLRIEDTDRARSTEAAIAAILDGLKWLGLDWDAEPVYQFSRAKRHAAVAQAML